MRKKRKYYELVENKDYDNSTFEFVVRLYRGREAVDSEKPYLEKQYGPFLDKETLRREKNRVSARLAKRGFRLA